MVVKTTAFDCPPPGLTTVTLAVPMEARSVAGMAAVSCVPLTKVVGRSCPFHLTTAPETKPEPVTVSVSPAVPTAAVFGPRLEITGAGTPTWSVAALDVPPPGAGLTTTMLSDPAAAMSVAKIAAVSCVVLTKLVARSCPLTRTTEPWTKPEPVTVRSKAAPPAETELGLRPVICAGGLPTVRLTELEEAPPGPELKTLTAIVPGAATSEDGIAAVSCVLLTKLVARSCPLTRTTELEVKPEPVTVRLKAAAPAGTVAGLRAVTCGAGLVTVKSRVSESPPSGGGLKTVMLTVTGKAMSVAGSCAVSCVVLTKVVGRSCAVDAHDRGRGEVGPGDRERDRPARRRSPDSG